MEFENIKMNPFSYYNYDYADKTDSEQGVFLTNKDQKNISKNSEKIIQNTNESNYLFLENKIKEKYNMLIPAIFMEIKSSDYFINFNKEDLKNVKIIFLIF